MNYSVDLNCRNYISKGKIALRLRLTINGYPDYIPLGRKINAEHYDFSTHQLISGFKGSTKVNTFITKEKTKIINIVDGMIDKGITATPALVKAEYLESTKKTIKVNPTSTDFKTYVENKIEWEKVEKEMEDTTFTYWEGQLKALLKYKAKITNTELDKVKISIHELNHDFIVKLKKWYSEEGKSDNSKHHILSFLKKYTGYLLSDKLISEDPFLNNKVGATKSTDPEWLEPEEIVTLHNLYDSKALLKIYRYNNHLNTQKRYRKFHLGAIYQNLLQQSLIAIYSGLRSGDMKALNERTHVVKNYIVKEMQKGRLGVKRTVRIPIHEKLNSVLDSGRENAKVYSGKMYESGTLTNKYLRDILHIADIDKHLTFHGLRHTFGINSLILGIPLEVVSDLMGHADIRTTQKYAKIVDRIKESETKKWDNIDIEAMSSGKKSIECDKCHKVLLEYHPKVLTSGSVHLTCPKCSNEFAYSFDINPTMKIAK